MASFEFTSSKDKGRCFAYVQTTIAKKAKDFPMDLMSSLLTIDHTSGEQELAEFWDLFITSIFRKQKRDDKETIKKHYPWGVWRIESTDAIDDAPTLWKGSVSREDDGAYQIHEYDFPLMKVVPAPEIPPSGGGFNLPTEGEEPDPNPEIVWELMIANQQGMDVMVGSINVGEIDAVCAVPHLPNFASQNQGSTLLAKWSLNPDLGLKHWQRRPNPIRIQAITNFMNASKSNLIINSIMLYIPEDAKGVEIEKIGNTAKITIRPREFLAAKGNCLTDVTVERDSEGNGTYTDHRPIWIVDGQHRTRGMALSPRGADLDVPIILTHGIGDNSVDLDSVAKVFTEINTLAKPLDEYQQHYLSHKFSIVAAEKDKTYGRPKDAIDPKDKKNRRVNIMMYKLASMLTDADGGPFENGVQLVDNRGSAMMSRIKLPEFLKQLRSFFTVGVYSDDSLTIEEIYEDFSNYLKAWENTANHETFANRPKTPRWKPNKGSNTSELEKSQPIVHIIFLMLPFFKKLLEEKGLEGSEKNYTDLLSPITGVDWLCPQLEKRFTKQYREASKYMAIWIKQAILNGEYRTYGEVASDDVDNVHHGMALYANPSDPVIEVIKGAVGLSFNLTWAHGNVYRKPMEAWVIHKGHRIELDSEPDWYFSPPGEESNEPSIAEYSFTVPYLEGDEDDLDWTVNVRIRNIWTDRVLQIKPEDYLDDENHG